MKKLKTVTKNALTRHVKALDQDGLSAKDIQQEIEIVTTLLNVCDRFCSFWDITESLTNDNTHNIKADTISARM